MIAYIQGELAEVSEDAAVLDVNGIGYLIHVSSRVAQSLPAIGQSVKLYTYTLVREDAFSLYGFLTRDDLDLFKKCITVNGIGPKGGLALLSVMDADTLRFAILSGDSKAIAKAPGIGPRTAERLILDLKGKVSLEDTAIGRTVMQGEAASAEAEGVVREAVEALVALGYGQTESLHAVRQVEHAEQLDSSSLLKAALKKMF